MENPLSKVSERGFAQLDLMLIQRGSLAQVRQLRSDRWQALASHHFLLEIVVEVGQNSEDSISEITQDPRHTVTALKEPLVRQSFVHAYKELEEAGCAEPAMNELNQSLCRCLHAAATLTLPVSAATPRKPWIRRRTLDLIDNRNASRNNEDRTAELALNKQIRKAAMQDRAVSLESIVSTGSWAEMKQLKRLRKPRIDNRRLCDSNGVSVESIDRAETFAQHLETVQWAVRPVNASVVRPALGPQIPTCSGTITVEELRDAVKKLKLNRAAVQIPAEYLRALLEESAINADCWLLRLMQLCWNTKSTPSAWHVSKVVPVFKKGSPAECDNYRPIS